MAIHPKHPKDLPQLVETLRKLTIEDTNLVIKIDEENGDRTKTSKRSSKTCRNIT